jgi:hypothetical protein
VNDQQRELEEDSAEEARHIDHPMVTESIKQAVRHARSGPLNENAHTKKITLLIISKFSLCTLNPQCLYCL